MIDDITHLKSMVLDERTALTLGELCQLCGIHAELVIEMVDEGVLAPQGGSPERWRFAAVSVTRTQRALRLARDLRLNWPGTALALDLLDQIEQLKRRRPPADPSGVTTVRIYNRKRRR